LLNESRVNFLVIIIDFSRNRSHYRCGRFVNLWDFCRCETVNQIKDRINDDSRCVTVIVFFGIYPEPVAFIKLKIAFDITSEKTFDFSISKVFIWIICCNNSQNQVQNIKIIIILSNILKIRPSHRSTREFMNISFNIIANSALYEAGRHFSKFRWIWKSGFATVGLGICTRHFRSSLSKLSSAASISVKLFTFFKTFKIHVSNEISILTTWLFWKNSSKKNIIRFW